jgi:hypothetical protein
MPRSEVYFISVTLGLIEVRKNGGQVDGWGGDLAVYLGCIFAMQQALPTLFDFGLPAWSHPNGSDFSSSDRSAAG